MSRNRSQSRARVSGARRRLSQNFLTDPATARMIVRASGVTADDLVLEIGPGDGMLTGRLIGAAGRVLAYEKDPRYARRLAVRYAGDTRVRVVHSDFRAITAPGEPFAVVSNVPFASTTDIVRWCLAAPRLTSATLLTQLEFARKHSGAYGRWTKLTVTHWPAVAITMGPRIDRAEFFPVPRVDGGLLHIVRRDQPLLDGRAHADYRQMVELGFSGVGGSLAASLRRAHSAKAVRAACATAGVRVDQPVGSVAPDRWISLYRQLRGS
ncbi:23S ribosomal RNA methyltransferase Erm [Nocardia donostiensis]|uniref:ErmE/ErmH/ErmO/ErmR family 23S rRNA (Adenine(2058)-N(6))-methyltransferase n=1 Tax=Nocardia donostiensis TaxID=1538463 RepID=A0A1V2TKM2_9NOCA|nr:23S ribosomal RNA methyltransferase Erm [Nocardia donostiensis]ONM50075.1 ErmE/ErmH/ErmO/ErmR family 23S rRNA (adenine(2058)-N(6))-methyltransferase [Nocardia donostiensis]OQS15737.1 ErmE/ErmH/ErmO/ErmR family 23S rRNA (adenine(2058)-N(6))-methyltransferase [Nocardia donostiensis]OQS19441.1 ErmE/ErmH/ErmO/ErmR family 23S rRNA (adenine(2058)-N(6))-methyltransferase [Nocardia donostiensis]